jgi:hypothetical protein
MSLGPSGDNVTCGGNSNASLTVNGTLQINSTTGAPSNGYIASTDGNGTISADQIDTGSTSSSSLGPGVSPSTPSQTGTAVSDPFAGINPPITGLLTATLTVGGTYQGFNVYASGLVSANPPPGIYAGNQPVTFPNGTTTLDGVYIFMDGLNLAGSQTLVSSAGGVLIYIYRGQMQMSGNAVATLSPYPTTSNPYPGSPTPWPGIVIWQDGTLGQGPGDPGDTQTLELAGNGSSSTYSGTIYAPSALAGTTGNGGLVASSLVSSGFNCGGNGSFTIG